MSAYKRFEMWLNGICPNCKERKLSLIKPKKPVHFKCLNCGSKYYYPHLWHFILLVFVIASPQIMRVVFDTTNLGLGKLFILTALFSVFIFVIGVPRFPKKPYIADADKAIK